MEDKRMKSKQRSDELHRIGQDFLRRRDNIPYGMRKEYIDQYAYMKNKIMHLLGAGKNDWDSWRWQMRNRVMSLEMLEKLINISQKEKEDIEKVSARFRWAVTPYYLALMDPDNPIDAIKAMSIPAADELCEAGKADPTGEEFTNPAGAVIRRYPDRLILNVTNACGSFCRYCQRRRNIRQSDSVASPDAIEASIRYIEENTEIRDVLITGGDPLVFSDGVLEEILKKVRRIKHVEIIRIGTRTPVTMPQRITPALVQMLKKYHPVFLNTQFNHPREITPEAKAACELLRDNGVVLGNQMVLLKGVNDDKYVVRLLNQELLRIGVRPYYIFHAKDVIGTLHFQTPLKAGVDIIEYLRGNTSGLAIPTYIISAPNGLGKIPLNPDYMIRQEPGKLILRTWENKEVTINY